ncbi:hypothetical protein IMZ48_42290 [Candidatus Bathyarchaeota archaeon]|nr:hypothetical protein [Candidatus Bathyarchaeota archaeon]
MNSLAASAIFASGRVYLSRNKETWGLVALGRVVAFLSDEREFLRCPGHLSLERKM